jgi:integrase
MLRGLRTIGRAFQELKASGRATTTDPAKMRLGDIQAFLGWMRVRPTRDGMGLRFGTQSNYLCYLKNLMRWLENPTWGRIEALSYMRLPRKCPPEIKVLLESEIDRVLDILDEPSNWDGAVAHFMVSMYLHSGLRRSELRRARVQDLDTINWSILVIHPKGEGIWSSAETALVLPPARQAVLDSLERRREYLELHGVGECEPLAPRAYSSGKMDYWTDALWGKVKAKSEKRTGMRFSIGELRATFAQMCIDKGASLWAVSRALRHKSCLTTELYYARMRPEKAFQELEGLF